MLNELREIVSMIPRGKVSTYGAVARAAGYPGRARQVAWALRGADARGLAWHRVLGSGGKILLTGDHSLEQRLRLKAEGVRFHGGRVDLGAHEHSFD